MQANRYCHLDPADSSQPFCSSYASFFSQSHFLCFVPASFKARGYRLFTSAELLAQQSSDPNITLLCQIHFSMEIDGSTSGSNVVYLSEVQHSDAGLHRCSHRCHIENIWANLYRCMSSNMKHICDSTCTQKILYDNHSSICIVSRQIWPLTPVERKMLNKFHRKRELDAAEPCGMKRRYTFRPSQTMNLAVPAAGGYSSNEGSMELN